MINPSPHIRKAFYACLNNRVLYKGANVPVYDLEGKGEPYTILIGETTVQEDSTRNDFGGSFQQLLEVVTEGKGYASRKAADEIGDRIMHLVQPAPGRNGLESPEFQIIGLRRSSVNYINEDGASGSKIVRLLIRYQFKINQINY